MSALVALTLLAGACSSDNGDATNSPTTTTAPDELSFNDGTPAGEGIGSEDYIVASEAPAVSPDDTTADGVDASSDQDDDTPSQQVDDEADDEVDEPDPAREDTAADDESPATTQALAAASTTTVDQAEAVAELDREVDQGFEAVVNEESEDLDIPVNPKPGDPGRLFEAGLTPADADVDLTLWFEPIGITATPSDVVQVPLNSVVSVAVISYAADDVTVEGYGLTTYVDPGDLAIVVFRADEAGSFDIRLEDAGVDLARIIVG